MSLCTGAALGSMAHHVPVASIVPPSYPCTACEYNFKTSSLSTTLKLRVKELVPIFATDISERLSGGDVISERMRIKNNISNLKPFSKDEDV